MAGLLLRGSCLLLALACALSAFAQQPPVGPPPPGLLFPPDWFSWSVMSIVKGENPIWTRGQKLVYNPTKSLGCRFEVQDLINITKSRGMAFCDFQGWRYVLNDTRGDPPCTSEVNFGSSSLPQLRWPDGFFGSAKFLGIDRVGDLNCNHYLAQNLQVNGKTIQFDAWTSVDGSAPCQISYFEIGTKIHYSWTFVGFQTAIPNDAWKCTAARPYDSWTFVGFQPAIPNDAWKCTAARVQCAKRDWKCSAKKGVHPDLLARALHQICDPRFFNCDPINPGGKFFEPNTLEAHVAWAFDAYFHNVKMTQGEAGCDFQGVAELVSPSGQVSLNSNSDNTFLENEKRSESEVSATLATMSVLEAWPLFLNDVVCPGMDSPAMAEIS